MGMIYMAIFLFAITALIGIYLLALVLRGTDRPKEVALIHGVLAATALVLVIVYTFNKGADLLQCIILFVIAALGGIILFVRDLMGRYIPKGLAIAHGMIAVAGFIFLLIYAFTK